jgi:hypothetical protein
MYVCVCPIEGGQKHLVWNKKGQWGSKEKGDYMAESEKELCKVGYTDN